MKRTYIDASILIAAFQAADPEGIEALKILDDPERQFVISDYLKLEVLPKPKFHKRCEEVDFMMEVINNATEKVPNSDELIEKAIELASQYDLSPMDAIHVAAAIIAEVDELVTLEKPTKPMCKVKEIKVVSIYQNTKRG